MSVILLTCFEKQRVLVIVSFALIGQAVSGTILSIFTLSVSLRSSFDSSDVRVVIVA